MLSKTFAYITTSVLVTMLSVIVWSNWYQGPTDIENTYLLEVYQPAPLDGKEEFLLRWEAGTQAGEEAFKAFLQVHNSGKFEEQNLVGRPDYHLVLLYRQEVWNVDVYGSWLRVLRPNHTTYTLFAPGWPEFHQQYITKARVFARVPSGLYQAVTDYLASRIAGEMLGAGDYLDTVSFQRLQELRAQQAIPDKIRGFDIKSVKEHGDNYSVILRVYGEEPTQTWEEEYTARPWGERYQLSLIKQQDYVFISP